MYPIDVQRKKKFTQLQRVMDSIGANKGYYQLERFKFTRQWLWRLRVDQLPGITIRISQEMKENAYKQHMDWLEANGRDRKNLLFYSDASLQPTIKQVETDLYR
jgi:hypothetical protein